MTETQLTIIQSQQRRKDFVVGIVLIILSLALGKLVLIPLVIFPGNTQWQISMFIVYTFSWLMLIVGIYFAGTEGLHIVKHAYKDYQRKTVHKVKYHSKRAAQRTAHVIRTRTERIRRRKD